MLYICPICGYSRYFEVQQCQHCAMKRKQGKGFRERLSVKYCWRRKHE